MLVADPVGPTDDATLVLAVPLRPTCGPCSLLTGCRHCVRRVRAVTPELYVTTLRLAEKDWPLHPISVFLEGPPGSAAWPLTPWTAAGEEEALPGRRGCASGWRGRGRGLLDLSFLGVGYSGIAEFLSQPGLTTASMGRSEKHPGHWCPSPCGCRGLPWAGAVGVLEGPVLVHLRSVFCEQRQNVYRHERRGGWARPVSECTVALVGLLC